MTARAAGGRRSATVATVIAIAILVSLGAWQLQRLHWTQITRDWYRQR